MKRELERAREETRKREEEGRVVVEKEEGRRDGASETKGKRCTGEGRFQKLERGDRGELI